MGLKVDPTANPALTPGICAKLMRWAKAGAVWRSLTKTMARLDSQIEFWRISRTLLALSDEHRDNFCCIGRCSNRWSLFVRMRLLKNHRCINIAEHSLILRLTSLPSYDGLLWFNILKQTNTQSDVFQWNIFHNRWSKLKEQDNEEESRYDI